MIGDWFGSVFACLLAGEFASDQEEIKKRRIRGAFTNRFNSSYRHVIFKTHTRGARVGWE